MVYNFTLSWKKFLTGYVFFASGGIAVAALLLRFFYIPHGNLATTISISAGYRRIFISYMARLRTR